MKIALDRFNSILRIAEAKINKHNDIIIEAILIATQEEKRLGEENDHSIRDL